MKLPVVLMEDDHAAKRLAIRRREQERRNEVAFEAPVLDPLSAESAGLPQVASSEFHGNRVRERQARSESGGQVGSHLTR